MRGRAREGAFGRTHGDVLRLERRKRRAAARHEFQYRRGQSYSCKAVTGTDSTDSTDDDDDDSVINQRRADDRPGSSDSVGRRLSSHGGWNSVGRGSEGRRMLGMRGTSVRGGTVRGMTRSWWAAVAGECGARDEGVE